MIIAQSAGHSVEILWNNLQLSISFQVESHIVVMIGNLENSVNQLLDRIIDRYGNTDKNGDTYKNTNNADYRNINKCPVQPRSGCRTIGIGSCQNLQIGNRQYDQEDNHRHQHSYCKGELCLNSHVFHIHNTLGYEIIIKSIRISAKAFINLR